MNKSLYTLSDETKRIIEEVSGLSFEEMCTKSYDECQELLKLRRGKYSQLFDKQRKEYSDNDVLIIRSVADFLHDKLMNEPQVIEIFKRLAQK